MKTAVYLMAIALAVIVSLPCLADPAQYPQMSSFLRNELKKHDVADDTESLLASLAHNSSSVRWISAQEMGRRKVTAAVPQLRLMLRDSSNVVRAIAAEALLELGDTSGIPTLKALLDSPFQWNVVIPARVLAKHGDDSGLERIRPLLQSELDAERLSAIRAFAASTNPRVSGDALGLGIEDKSELVRTSSLCILRDKATPEAIALIAGVLTSKRSEDRRLAAQMLNQVHKVEAIPFLIEALVNDDVWVRETAVLGINYMVGKVISTSTKKGVRNIEDARRVQAEWQQWWEKNKATFVLGPKTPPKFADE